MKSAGFFFPFILINCGKSLTSLIILTIIKNLRRPKNILTASVQRAALGMLAEVILTESQTVPSDEVITDGLVDITKYPIVDLILGEEKTTELPDQNHRIQYQAFPAPMQEVIRKYVANKGRLFISGAYIASDLYHSGSKEDRDFADKILKIRLAANHAVRNGEFYATDPGFALTPERYGFCTEMNSVIYNVEAPDALAPANSDAKVILRYSENQFGAGIAYRGNYRIICFGFPFETIETPQARDLIMQSILKYLSTPDNRK